MTLRATLIVCNRRINTNHLRSLSTFAPCQRLLAMQPGSPLPGLDFLKNVDPPVTKERSEYPSWINDLDKPMKNLASFRNVQIENSDEADQLRFLKLTRRKLIKEKNIDAGVK